jgi:hypothetical protein
MIRRAKIGDWRITLTVARVSKVIGVNSNLPDGKHIIMWDFDDLDIRQVKDALIRVQGRFVLPEIRVVSSGTENHYLAYCFKRSDWIDALRVVICTDGVDANFIRFSAFRQHFTLRVTPKENHVPRFETVLLSEIASDCDRKELLSWVKYETMRKG